MRYLYSNPRTTVNDAALKLGVEYQPINRLVKAMVAGGVLVPSSNAKRNIIYDFKRYLDIFVEESSETL